MFLCDSPRPTTAHVLSACPVALSQDRYTYRHEWVLQFLVKSIVRFFVGLPFVYVYADLPNFRASGSPPSTIPTDLMVTPYRPDIVIHNTATSSLMLFELTCPLDSTNHLEQAKESKAKQN